MEFRDQNFTQLKEWIEKGFRRLKLAGLSGTPRVYFLAQLLMEMDRPSLVVLPEARDATLFARALEFFVPETYRRGHHQQRRLYHFPIYDISPLAGLSPHRDVTTHRLGALYALTAHQNPIAITSTEALLLRILPKNAFLNALEYMEAGEEVERDHLLQRLQKNGYLRSSLVEEVGDYAVRGGVVDIFSPLYELPIRLEFWGDRIESIRHFDTLNQRSTQHLNEMVLLPANEIIMDKQNVERARSMGRLPSPIQGETSFAGQEAWLNHFYTQPDTLFDYFSKNGLLILINAHRIDIQAKRFPEKFQKDAERYRREAEDRENPFPEIGGLLLSPETIDQHFESYQRIEFSELPLEGHGAPTHSLQVKETFTVDEDLDLRIAGKGRVSMAPLAEKISEWLSFGSRVVLVCRTEQQAHRLTEILHNYEVKVDESVKHWEEVSPGRGLSTCLGRLSKGFAWPELGLYVVSEDEIFGSKRPRLRTPERAEEGRLRLTAFSQINAGDLVVHEDHGIGRYGGLHKMEIEQKANDFVLIEYANNDRLYIPADRISVLQKYMGADEKNPKLDRLGGRSWDLAKQRARRSIREIAQQLVQIYAIRRYRKGYAFSSPDNYFREFEATFEHEETPDQIKAIDEILSDMASDTPMDRLICGDVGFGKTEVAIRAAFKAVMDGKQVALLVPTTVLAEQHYDTFRKRMESYQIRIEVISRFKTRKEQREILATVRSGKTDILIGTHRMLQKDVSFRDLGLLIIDEEQRFGVKQKEKLRSYRALVDVLALTATPIPRTLHMSLMGVRDLSIIETPPEDRLAIQTHLSPYDEALIVHAIELELERGGQVFFVHNRVQTIEPVANKLMQLLPEARFAIAHGQMKAKDLEETMIRFLRKDVDVLVCTTIIESGLDIPSTNTIIINGTNRLGLSEIYQLRGRVGRSKENAYAYLLLSDSSGLSREAEKRLKALMDFSHLGAGFHLALHDLKIRGGGNILGYSQSGHISAIGYELYMKLIEQTVAELKGEQWHEETNPEINVSIPAFLPEDYISDIDVRLNLYRRLSGLREESELKAIAEEINDRFGPQPHEVANLLSVMSVRLLLKRMEVSTLDISQETLTFTFSPNSSIDPEKLVQLVQKEPENFRFSSERRLEVKTRKRSALEALLDVKKVAEKLQQAAA